MKSDRKEDHPALSLVIQCRQFQALHKRCVEVAVIPGHDVQEQVLILGVLNNIPIGELLELARLI